METVKNLLEWWNLIYVLPFITGLFYLGMMMVGMVGHDHDVELEHDADIGHEVSIEHSAEIGHEVEHDIGHEAGAETDQDHDHSMEHEQDAGPILRLLTFFGLGRIPVSLLVMSWCFIWGPVGCITNNLLADYLKYPVLYIWPSLGITFFLTAFATRWFARGLSRIMPSTETYLSSRDQLVGKRAEAIYEISADFGIARLRDNYGTSLDVPCRTRPGDEVIAMGNQVVLMQYVPEEKYFLVRNDPLAQHGLIRS